LVKNPLQQAALVTGTKQSKWGDKADEPVTAPTPNIFAAAINKN
jgi:hypothetical protein